MLRSYRELSGQGGDKALERCLIKRNLCEFHLGLFWEWERSCDRLQLTTPRELELDKIKRVSPNFVNLEDH